MSEIVSYTVFLGSRSVGGLRHEELIPLLRTMAAEISDRPPLVFDDRDGRQVDFDLTDPSARPGRPKLGVVSREVTLLPRHWEWLESQPSGASAALRRLVESASRAPSVTAAKDAACRFMSAVAGDLPGYEEATRALYAANRGEFDHRTQDWPEAVRDYAIKLAGPALSP